LAPLRARCERPRSRVANNHLDGIAPSHCLPRGSRQGIVSAQTNTLERGGHALRGRRADVRFGSKADMCGATWDVRYTPNSDRESGLPQTAMSALPPCVDGSELARTFLNVCSIGRCSHVFGLLARHVGPLAIMPCADQVPINSPHLRMRGGKWVVLIARST